MEEITKKNLFDVKTGFYKVMLFVKNIYCEKSDCIDIPLP